jgi:hypothetical protein
VPAAPVAPPAPSKPVDPLDELFGGPAPPAAPVPAAAAASPAAATYGAADIFGPAAAVPASYGPPPPAAAAVAGLGPGSGSMASYGSYGMPGGPMPPVAAGATGFTSAPSWSSVQGMHGLHPAASTGSTYSAGYGDPFGQAVAAAGLKGATAGVPAAAMGLQHQQPPQQPAAAAAGSLGFDDAAFAPADDWRVLGDVQQWYRTLLTKEKVRGHGPSLLQSASATPAGLCCVFAGGIMLCCKDVTVMRHTQYGRCALPLLVVRRASCMRTQRCRLACSPATRAAQGSCCCSWATSRRVSR